MTREQWADFESLPIDPDFEYGVCRRVSDEMGSENIRVSIIWFDPGEGGPKHYHDAPAEEYYYVVEGKLDITVGDNVVEADAGTVVYTPPEVPHQPQNNYDEPALLLAFSSPSIPASEGVTVVEDAK